jgi:Protein of unknown function (DUF4242)
MRSVFDPWRSAILLIAHEGVTQPQRVVQISSMSESLIFCLVEAPDAEAANTVHRLAHGLVADEIYPVAERT